ncbi:MAG: leucine--tRNA ligase [Candidatus Vogelbacteria bacterium]|nr:leucine--tRNA ligase [Candidatus Vogelbacteria bacterium]
MKDSKINNYDHKKIETKWQKRWEKSGIYKALDKSKKPKFYSLIEFPYPSGDGLHVGHIRSNTAMDIISRKRRMEGYNVLYPIGWDAFGLPTENYAIKTGIHPIKITKQNTDTFRRQLKSCGFSFDWDREVNTTDPGYYKWTQWIFLQLLKNGLAYKKKMPINWCLSCKIGLANEEVIDNHCERCGGETDKREKEQWMLAITKYAEKLDKDLDLVDYTPNIKLQQRNWIGRSEGAEIDFKIRGNPESITVFTTRADTIFGATYLVLAPDHPILVSLKSKILNWQEVGSYGLETKKKTEVERTSEGKEKTGVELKGIKAINPANQREIPIFVADYVLSHYGTGAIMAVPAHDKRDKEFAEKFGLSIVDEPFVNAEEITRKVGGKITINYKLRDWVFSRQRYWGEPIPVINCETCGLVSVPEKDLPVKLPNIKNYKPTDTGESPLALVESWVRVRCPKCKEWAKRETDTMPNWAGSSWYYLRYIDAKNKKAFADSKKLKSWLPVDWYNGGMEHVTLHLLYSRFWHKFLYDQKLVPTKEPYKKRTAHGFVLAPDGQKMSKSKGNVINPDSIVKLLGADTLRVYEMFMGPFADAISWNTESVAGSRRFIERVWRAAEKVSGNKKEKNDELEYLVNNTVKKVSDDYEGMKFNTAVSAMMILLNEFDRVEFIPKSCFETFLILLAPLAPHVTEELWETLGNKKSIHFSLWPKYKLDHKKNCKIKIVIQVNSKVRDMAEVAMDLSDEELKVLVLQRENVNKWINGQAVKKVFIVKNRLINIVI